MVRLYAKMTQTFCVLFLCAIAVNAAVASQITTTALIEDFLNDRHPSQDESWFLNLGSEAAGIMMSMYPAQTSVAKKMRLSDAVKFYRDNSEVGIFFIREIEAAQSGVLKRNLLANYVKYLNGNGPANIEIDAMIKGSDPATQRAVLSARKSLKAGARVKNFSVFKNKLPQTDTQPNKKSQE